MLLVISIVKTLIATGLVGVGVLIVVFAYRQLLKKLSQNQMIPQAYCTLHEIEKNPASGIIQLYFTAEEVKTYRLELLDLDSNLVTIIADTNCKVGGNIVSFDTTAVSDGNYLYQLVTDNQKTTKKVSILNR